jgi:membrane protease YdiL (CAAX protease family)
MSALLLLLIALGAIAWFQKSGRGAYRRLKTLSDTEFRQRRYRRWIARAALAFALPALIGLALLHRLAALTQLPPEFAPARALLPVVEGSAAALATGLLGGAAVGGLIAGILAATRSKRSLLPPFGNVGTLMPRNRPERAYATAVSVFAGITEELAFRLYLPLLITLVTGSAILAFALAALLFGTMHRYQGWGGVTATTLVGLVMTAVYLVTGALWLAMLLHALVDLNGLVLRSVLHPPAGAKNHRDHDQA